MVNFRLLGVLLALSGVSSSQAEGAGVELKAVALVESRAPFWKPVPASARIDPQGLSFKRKVFLEGRSAIPVRAAVVRKALAEALKPLSRADRASTREVLRAIGEWADGNLAEAGGPLACPSSWMPADQVLVKKSGNRFELVRAVTAMLRCAGIPARPSFNGLPMVCLFVVPEGGKGFWTVWDPFHPGASLGRLPVLWLPLRAEEVPLVSARPEISPCEPAVEGRRFTGRAEAEKAFESARSTGLFPAGESVPLPAGTAEWWEVWIVGAKFEGAIAGKTPVSFPLPFVIDPLSRCGTREWAVWSSDPSRLKGRPSAHTRTDQELGGILMNVRVDLGPAPISSTNGA